MDKEYAKNAARQVTKGAQHFSAGIIGLVVGSLKLFSYVVWLGFDGLREGYDELKKRKRTKK